MAHHYDDDNDLHGGQKEIQIVRRDAHGRELTTKESFRQLCHTFHGKEPSRNTKEKRERKRMRELKTQQSIANQDLPALEGSMKAAKKHYVVITSKNQ